MAQLQQMQQNMGGFGAPGAGGFGGQKLPKGMENLDLSKLDFNQARKKK